MLHSKPCLWAKRKHNLHIQTHIKTRIYYKYTHDLNSVFFFFHSRFTYYRTRINAFMWRKTSITMQLKFLHDYFLLATPFPGVMLILPLHFRVQRQTVSFLLFIGVLCWDEYDICFDGSFFLTLLRWVFSSHSSMLPEFIVYSEWQGHQIAETHFNPL